MTASLLRAMLMAGRVEVKTVKSVVRALMMSVDARAAEDSAYCKQVIVELQDGNDD